jgi:hypothetical protein
MPIFQYYCLDWDNITYQGNYYAPEYQWVNLIFYQCIGEDYCANDTEFAYWFLDAQVEFFYISSFFDSNNYTKPIRYFLDDAFWTMVPEYSI